MQSLRGHCSSWLLRQSAFCTNTKRHLHLRAYGKASSDDNYAIDLMLGDANNGNFSPGAAPQPFLQLHRMVSECSQVPVTELPWAVPKVFTKFNRSLFQHIKSEHSVCSDFARGLLTYCLSSFSTQTMFTQTEYTDNVLSHVFTCCLLRLETIYYD
jgi:hypothetical protein